MIDLSTFVKKIEGYDSIVIFGHVNPDGDCYGSQIGLKEAIKMNYPDKKVYAIGSGFQKMIPYLCPMDEIDEETIKQSLAIAVDFAQLGRAEDSRISLAKDQIVIDHHVLIDTFGSWQWIDDGRIAACEMLTELIKVLNWKISKLGANALFLGLTTDSGRFQYQPTTASTFHLAAFLLENGADPNYLYLPLYEINESSLHFRGYIYSHYQKTKSGVIYKIFTEKELEKFGLTPQQAVSSVNLLGNIKGFPIWLCAAGNEEIIRVEIRSSCFNVQTVCANHGGGGHPLAAGCRATDLEEVKAIIDELNDLIKKGEKVDGK